MNSEFSGALDRDARIRNVGSMFATGFLPAARLERVGCYEFASELAEHIELGPIVPESNQWTLQGVDRHEGVEVVVRRDSLQCSTRELPRGDERRGQEWTERLITVVLSHFEQRFRPSLCVGTQVSVRGLLQTTGDARAFLGEKMMRLDPDIPQVMQRPLNVLGVRLEFPPAPSIAAGSPPHGEAWGVDVRIESFAQDPTQLFIEVQSVWPQPRIWSEDAVEALVLRMKATDDVLKDQVWRLLHKVAAGGEASEGFRSI